MRMTFSLSLIIGKPPVRFTRNLNLALNPGVLKFTTWKFQAANTEFKSQVESFGLGHKFKEVKQKYMEANLLLGDIVKVTPSSKVVGDMAIFMVQNGLDMDNIYEKGRDLAYPNSVVDYFKGMIGQPEGGFDPKLQEIVLKGIEPITVRPGTLLPDEDFEAIKEEYREEFGIELAEREVTSAALYPKVFKNYVKFYQDYGDFMRMDTHAFSTGSRKARPQR